MFPSLGFVICDLSFPYFFLTYLNLNEEVIGASCVYVKCVFVTPLSSTDSSVANKEQQQGAKGILWGESHVTQRECLYLYVESKQSTCLTSLLLQKLISKGKCIERWSLSVTFYSRNHQNEKIWLHISCLFTIYLLPSIVLISRDIVCQRRWRRLATEYAGVDKLLDHLHSTCCSLVWLCETTCRVIPKTWIRGLKFTLLDICLNVYNIKTDVLMKSRSVGKCVSFTLTVSVSILNK